MEYNLYYHFFIEKPNTTMLAMLKQSKCNIGRDFIVTMPDIHDSFTYKFDVYAEVKRPQFVTKSVNPDDLLDDFLLDDNQVCLINISSLFQARLNMAKSNVIITPRSINVKPWVMNYNLCVYVKFMVNTHNDGAECDVSLQ